MNTWKYGKAAPLFRNAVSEKVGYPQFDDCRSLVCALPVMESICSEEVRLESCIRWYVKLMIRYVWYLSSGDLLRVVDVHYKVDSLLLSDH